MEDRRVKEETRQRETAPGEDLPICWEQWGGGKTKPDEAAKAGEEAYQLELWN